MCIDSYSIMSRNPFALKFLYKYTYVLDWLADWASEGVWSGEDQLCGIAVMCNGVVNSCIPKCLHTKSRFYKRTHINMYRFDEAHLHKMRRSLPKFCIANVLGFMESINKMMHASVKVWNEFSIYFEQWAHAFIPQHQNRWRYFWVIA